MSVEANKVHVHRSQPKAIQFFVFLLSMNKSLILWFNNFIFTSTSLKLVRRLFSDAAFTRDGFKEIVYDKYGLRNKLNAIHIAPKRRGMNNVNCLLVS